MTDDLALDLLDVFAKHNIISETYRTHERIRIEYGKLRRQGMKARDAREKLAEENFTGIKNIEKILYFYGKKKQQKP